ncbi:hypothetical protein OAN22_01185 [Alphaproteobacteria bacterium]|nr:hypothetical protein [Alphaproteobacteria bacterium]
MMTATTLWRFLFLTLFALQGTSCLLWAEEAVEVRMDQMEQDIRRLSGELAQLRMDHKMKEKSAPVAVPHASPSTPSTEPSSPASPVEKADGPQEAETDPIAGLIQEQDSVKIQPLESTEQIPDLSPKPPQNQSQPVMSKGMDQAAYVKARDLLSNREYIDATENFELFLDNFPQSELAANAAYWLGESYSALENWPAAAKAYGRAYSCGKECLKQPASAEKRSTVESKIPASLLKLSDILGRLDKKDQACVTLETLRKEFTLTPPQIRTAENLAETNKCPKRS